MSDHSNPISVIGGGLMGAGIAQVFAAHGFRVQVFEPFDEVRATINDRIAANLKLMEDPEIDFDLISATVDMAEALDGADFLIEAVPERLDLKQKTFADIERHASADCILASNTSVIPISHIAADLKTPHRVIGTHWWNPPYLVPLVEVVPGEKSDPTCVDRMADLLTSVGKKPVKIKRDVPGFVGNRLQHALWREAHALISEGVCDARTVDDVVKNSFGLRLAVLGPIENADMVGLDLTEDIHNTIIPELTNRTEPNPHLKELVAQGKLGFKTDEGFRTWTEEEKAETTLKMLTHLKNAVRKI